MRRQVLFAGMILACACAWFLPPTSVRAGASSEACGLYTRADAEGLFSQTVSDGVARSTTFPAGESCRYSFTAKGDSYGITVRVSTSAAIREEGINDSAADVMTRQKKAHQAGGHAAETFHPVPGLGDDAFWNGSDLWVLQGDTLLIVTIHSVLEGSYKDMASAQAAREEQDLALSQKAAQTVLPRLK
jgi:hypothetical protein